MTFTWRFYTGNQAPRFAARRCFRGPMIAVETTMSQQFLNISAAYNVLRMRLLDAIVGTDIPAVRTREVVLRVMDSDLGAIFERLGASKEDLQANICEKRNSLAVLADLGYDMPFYSNAANALSTYGVAPSSINLIVSAVESNNPAQRVAGVCAVILMVSFMELDATQ